MNKLRVILFFGLTALLVSPVWAVEGAGIEDLQEDVSITKTKSNNNEAKIQGLEDKLNGVPGLQAQIDAIELIPGPAGPQGVAGPAGADGADGVDGLDFGLNVGTNPEDLLTWDGDNWVALPPAFIPVTHDNMQPSLGINYIIALQGIYPSRNSLDPFIAEIIMFAGNFAPRGWAFCDGQLLSIAQNTALFSLLGTTFGGDGRTTFGLPDLRGRVPVHPGTAPGLTQRRLGYGYGSEGLDHTY